VVQVPSSGMGEFPISNSIADADLWPKVLSFLSRT
jgi:hypothetical protein